MAFIIALGIIIVLLCSASVFRLIQPKNSGSRLTTKKIRSEPVASHSKPVKAASFVKPTRVEQPKRKVIDDLAEDDFGDDEFSVIPVEHEQDEEVIVPTAKSATPASTAKIAPVMHVQIPEVIAVNLRALADKPYAGYELLQALLSSGMRFSNTGLFYRHEKKTGTGAVLFSLASCTKEGTIDLSAIGGFSCKWLILFMKPKEVQDPVKVFELMLETADQLIHDLGGDVLNDNQQLLIKEDVIATHEKLQRYAQACVVG